MLKIGAIETRGNSHVFCVVVTQRWAGGIQQLRAVCSCSDRSRVGIGAAAEGFSHSPNVCIAAGHNGSSSI